MARVQEITWTKTELDSTSDFGDLLSSKLNWKNEPDGTILVLFINSQNPPAVGTPIDTVRDTFRSQLTAKSFNGDESYIGYDPVETEPSGNETAAIGVAYIRAPIE